MTNGNLPKHLEVAAKTAVLGARARDDMPYRMVASEIDLTSRTTTFVDLGGMPQPSNNARIVEEMIEKGKSVNPEDWYLTLRISQNDIDDDQTGTLRDRFTNILPAFQRHINSRVFTVLNAGDGTTYDTALTGLSLFNDSQVYPNAKNQTAQDNKLATVLTLDNFNAAWVAARLFKDDMNNYYNLPFDTLIHSVTLNQVASQISGNPNAYDTANNEINPYQGTKHLAVPEFDTTAWVLVAGSAPDIPKPMFVAIRKRPALLSMWFDSQAGDGGVHFFQYHGRYVVGYGDPLLAIMGNT